MDLTLTYRGQVDAALAGASNKWYFRLYNIQLAVVN